MAEYDGSIRINTKIDTKNVSSQMLKVANDIKKSESELARLNQQMDSLKQKKIPTEQYKQLQAEAKKAEAELEKLHARMGQRGAATEQYKGVQSELVKAQKELQTLVDQQNIFEEIGVPSGSTWDALNNQIADASDRVDDLKQKLSDMEDSGEAYKPKVDPEKIEEAEKKVDDLKRKLSELESSGAGFSNGSQTADYEKMESKASQLSDKINVSKVRMSELAAKQKPVAKGFSEIGEKAKKAMSKASDGAKKSGKLLGTMASRFRGIMLSLLVFNWISKAFNAMVAGMGTGFKNLMGYSSEYANSVQSLKNAMSTLGNSFAAAFAPIVQAVIPWLTQLIGVISTAISYVSQFFAILGGRGTYTRAKKIQDSYSSSLDKTAASAKKATQALAKFDDLDVLNKDDSSGGGGGGGTSPKDMFEEIPVDSKVVDWLDGIKEKLSPILDYLEKMRDAFAEGFFKALGDPTDRLETIRKGLEQIKTAMIDIWTDPDVLGAADRWAMSLMEMLGSFAGMIASVGLSLAAFFIGGFGQYLENDTDKIKQWLIRMFDIGAEINQLFESLFVGIAKVCEALASENGIRMSTAMFGSFFSAMGGMSEMAAKIGRDLLEVIVQPFTDNAGIFEHAFEGLFGSTATYLEGLKQALDDSFMYINRAYDKYVKPFVDSFANGISSIITNFINAWEQYTQPTIDRIAEKMSSLMNDHFVPLVAVVSSIVGHITSLLQSAWETIIQPILDWIINYVGILLVEVFNLLVDILLQGIQIIIDGFTTFMAFLDTFVLRPWAEGWENAKEIFAYFCQCINELSEFLRKSIEQVFKIIRKLIDGDWKGAWDTAVDIFDKAKQAIIDKLSALKAFVADTFNSIKEKLSELWESIGGFSGIGNAIGGMFGGGGGGKASTMSVPTEGAAVALNSIPALASGAVIHGGNPFLAILGDQRAGQTNIEAPLATIKQAFVEALSESSFGGGLGSARVILNVNGSDLAEATVDDFLSTMRRKGYDTDVFGYQG